MKLKAYVFTLLLFTFSASAFAEASSVAMLKQVSSQMITSLDQQQGHLNRQAIDTIVHRVLLPHVDLETMARSVVGKQYWTAATPGQREQFKQVFTNLIIKVYAAPLSTYHGDKIEFKPLRDEGAARPQVESVIIRQNGQHIPVSYRLVQSGGAWKVYDFSVEGISMISSYRSQFDSILQQQGMTGLINRLKTGN